MDHVKIEIGLGRFEAFTIIGPLHDSSVHESVAAALVWLSGQFIASVMSTEVEVPKLHGSDLRSRRRGGHGAVARQLRRAGRPAGPAGQVAAAASWPGPTLHSRRIGPGNYNRSSSGPVRCRSWIAVRCASNAG